MSRTGEKIPHSAVGELERAALLFQQIARSAHQAMSPQVLESLAEFLDAEAASVRILTPGEKHPVLAGGISLGIPETVRDAYASRYYRWDPARRVMRRRLAQPLFPHPVREGEWSGEQVPPQRMDQYKKEFHKYREEFLLPNNLHHHLGFCIEGAGGQKWFYDFHRGANALPFGRLEQARVRVAGWHLHECARQSDAVDSMPGSFLQTRLSRREVEVVLAVARGLSNKEIAHDLDISVRTVENHLRAVFPKLNVSTRSRLIAKVHHTL